MNCWKRFWALVLLLILVWVESGQAQKQRTIDADRMNRDINIMETILGEMFKLKEPFDGGNFVMSGSRFLDSTSDVRGTYLPGFGVVFTIPAAEVPFIIDLDREGDRQPFNYSFVYSITGDGDHKVDEKTVTDKIREFLKNYASTVGQLNPADRVAVIYGYDRVEKKMKFMFTNSAKQEENFALPVILGQVQKKDLDAYRAGEIDERQIDERISISGMNSEKDRNLDLEVMANILKTVFQDNPGKDSFRIRGPVGRLKLDHFGALFFFEAGFPSTSELFGFDLASRLQTESDNARAAPRAGTSILQELDKKMEDEQKARKDLEQERREKTLAAFSRFKQLLKEYMVDYGRTLRSVGSNQVIMVSVSVSVTGYAPGIPDRVDMAVEKSILEALDRGEISRSEALNRIRITEQSQ